MHSHLPAYTPTIEGIVILLTKEKLAPNHISCLNMKPHFFGIENTNLSYENDKNILFEILLIASNTFFPSV